MNQHINRSWRSILSRAITLLVILMIWQFISLLIKDERTFPGIDYLLKISLPSLAVFEGGKANDYCLALWILLKHSGITIFRILIGLIAGSFAGVLAGFAIHFLAPIKRTNTYLLMLVRSVPLFALIPLFLYWFGGRESSIYSYISFGIFVIVATNTFEALSNVSPGYILQAKLLGANRLQIFSTVHFHAIQPEMLGAWRTAVGLSWAFSLGAEYLASTSGLGYLVYQSYLYSDMGKLVLLATIYGCYGIISYKLLQAVLDNTVRWQMIGVKGGVI